MKNPLHGLVSVGSMMALTVWNAGCYVCTTEMVTSVMVTVVDGSGNPVTDAVVQYSVDGRSGKICEHHYENFYQCGLEEDGKFAITATHGAVTKAETVDVRSDACHVETEQLIITLAG